MDVFDLRKEASVPEENSCEHKKSKHTSYTKTPAGKLAKL